MGFGGGGGGGGGGYGLPDYTVASGHLWASQGHLTAGSQTPHNQRLSLVFKPESTFYLDACSGGRENRAKGGGLVNNLM